MERSFISTFGGAAIVLVIMAAVGIVAIINFETIKFEQMEAEHSTAAFKAIQAICDETEFRDVCVHTVSSVTGNSTTDHKELIKSVILTTKNYTEAAFNHSMTVSEAIRSSKNVEDQLRDLEALVVCRELFGYAISELEWSLDKMNSLDVRDMESAIEDVSVWLSAVVTYKETCLDGFDNTTTTKAGMYMRKAMDTGMKLARISLGIVTEIADVLGKNHVSATSVLNGIFNGRKLLQHENDGQFLDSWIPTNRRLSDIVSGKVRADVTVSVDGSGDYRTIGDAVLQIPGHSQKLFVIHVKEGVYREKVTIRRQYTNVMFIGDGPTKTKITNSLNFVDGTPTFKTATFAVIGDGFIAKDITFENTAGPEKREAVALRVQADKSAFYNCHIIGYQDTLYAHTKRQFYRDCTISGTVDFIFGDAAAVFQNCRIIARKPLDGQKNVITAQARIDRRQPTGFVIQNCTVSADDSLAPYKSNIPTFLGRPIKEFSRTLFLQSQLDDLIDPQGWLPWMGNFGLNTCFYAEVGNRGAGARTKQRVDWPGVKRIGYRRVGKYTAERFIQGHKWIADTGVPFIPGFVAVP